MIVTRGLTLKRILNFFSVAVAKEFQGKGIGKRMVLDAENLAIKKGYDCVYLASLPWTEEFYIKCGYLEEKCGENDGWFKKKLKQKPSI